MWQIRISNIKIYILCNTQIFSLFSVSFSKAAVLIVTLVQIFIIVQQTPDGANGLVHPCQPSDCLGGEYRGLPVLLLEHGLIHLVHDALVVLGGVVDVGLVVPRPPVDPVLNVHAVVALAGPPPLAVADDADQGQEDDQADGDDHDPPGEGGGQVDAAGLTPHHLAQAGADLAVIAANILRAEAAH